jgi:hypothetical protein
VIDPTISLYDSVDNELASTPFVAGHSSVLLDEKFDVGLTELWIVAREGYGFVALFTLE